MPRHVKRQLQGEAWRANAKATGSEGPKYRTQRSRYGEGWSVVTSAGLQVAQGFEDEVEAQEWIDAQ